MPGLVPAVLRAAILELFLGPEATLSAGEIVERVGLPPEDLAERLRGRKLTALTGHRITSRPALLAQVAQVRAHGVAYERSESNPDAGCVAAPVPDAHGQWVAAMTIAVPTSRHS